MKESETAVNPPPTATTTQGNEAYREAEHKILSSLDLIAEAVSLGTRFPSHKPNGAEWHGCHAIDRTDKSPSAALNISGGPGALGRYKDHGGVGLSLSFFELAAKLGPWKDWREARAHYAKKTGVQLPGGNDKQLSANSVEEQVKWIPNPTRKHYLFRLGKFASAKPPIETDALVAANARYAMWPARAHESLICFGFEATRDFETTCAILLYRHCGRHFSAIKSLPKRKTHLVNGSKDGWIIFGKDSDGNSVRDQDAIKSCETIWRVEGVLDALALFSHLPHGCAVLTNVCGAMGVHKLPMEFLRGKKVIAIGDADQPGQDGNDRFARAAASEAEDVRIVQLPFEVTPNDGKDVRDFFTAGDTFSDLEKRAGGAEKVAPAPAGKQSQEKELAPYTPFPTNVLPDPLGRYIREAAQSMSCDDAMIALPLMAAVAAAIGNTRRIQPKPDWQEPCVIWAIVIAHSGMMKSPAFDKAMKFLRDKQTRAFQEHEDEFERYKLQKTQFEAELDEWKKKGRKNGDLPPAPPKVPVAVRYVCADTTVEALAVLLEKQPRGLLLARDELSGFISSFDAYKATRGADVAQWLEMHRAGSLTVDRKSGLQVIHVPRASVSIAGCVQPEILKTTLGGRSRTPGSADEVRSTPEHIANGFAARLLMAMPPRKPKRWTEDVVSAEAEGAIEKLFDVLQELDFDTDAQDRSVPVDLPLTTDGKKAFVRFYNEHSQEECSMGADLAAAWSKLEAYAPRIALLVHLVRSVTEDPTLLDHDRVDAQSIQAGIELSRWFGEEASRTYESIGATGESDEKRNRRQLIQLIRDRGGRITTRELTHAARKYRDGTNDAESALNELASAKLGQWEVIPTGGRPRTEFVLNSDDGGNGSPLNHGNDGLTHPLPPAVETESETEEDDWGEV
jgi:hypothetical protein